MEVDGLLFEGSTLTILDPTLIFGCVRILLKEETDIRNPGITLIVRNSHNVKVVDDINFIGIFANIFKTFIIVINKFQ